MCGITGIINRHTTPNIDDLKSMTDTIAHRGPDGEGFFVEKNIALGHRRLAIIDLSPAGAQPMQYKGKNGEYVITYNGEIYNYLELKHELQKEGYCFKSNTDTEIILAAYDKWQTNCLQYFNGMWAFVIYDKTKNIIFGSRDRFGVKPFYYIYNDHNFTFASEIKALLKLSFYKPDLNEKAVFEYLVLGQLEWEEEGFFKNIFELFPACAFILNLNTFELKKWKYYELHYVDKYEKFEQKKFQDYVSNIKDYIFNAVNIRLRSDVPVGSCLSGGLDSSTIVCVISEILKNKKIDVIGEYQKTFTASYKNEPIDESKWAKIVAQHTKAQWFEVYPNSDELLQDIEDLIYYQDIPFGSTSIYAQYRVIKLAKENGVKVLLDGQGGDELFTGYPTYYSTFYYELLKNDLLRLIKELKHYKNSAFMLSHILKFMLSKIVLYPLNISFINTLALKKEYSLELFNDHFLNSYKQILKNKVEALPNSLNQHLYQLITSKNLKALLRFEDRNSMRFSLESRTPFADDINLIEYVFQIPSTYKIYNGWNKYLLRSAMRTILPEQIRLRTDKLGFVTPQQKWLLNNKSWILYILNSNKEYIKEYINIQKLLSHINTNNLPHNKSLLWKIINFVMWRKVYKV